MRVIRAAAMIVILAGPAYAQQEKPMQKYGEPDKDKTEQEKAADKAAEHAYQRSLGNIPDQGPTDPWGVVRSTDAPKTAAKPATKKPSAKAGSTPN
jgi:hypothetical protein